MGFPNIYTKSKTRCLLSEKYMQMQTDGRLPKDCLYNTLANSSRPTGHPELWFKDLLKCQMRNFNISPHDSQSVACNRDNWRVAHSQDETNSLSATACQWMASLPLPLSIEQAIIMFETKMLKIVIYQTELFIWHS